MNNMKVEVFGVAYQIYLIPTLKITHSKWLNGCYEIQLIWLKHGVSFNFGGDE